MWIGLLDSGEEVLYFVGREVRANDVTAVVPHVGDISEEGLPSYLTSDGVLDVVLSALV